jgi:hypothetical protein
MRGVRSPAGFPLTWMLALAFLAMLDVGVTRTSVLWGATALEHTREPQRIAFAQAYAAARAIYHPTPAAGRRVALLGNSRIWLTGRPSYLGPELARVAPGRDIAADDLAIFGAGIGDMEVLSRHLARLSPDLVVATIGTSDLLGTAAAPISGVASDLLRIGWGDGPDPAGSPSERVDRWLRTIWPLYRFREFGRAALLARIMPADDPGPFPAHFADVRAVFDYMHGPDKGAVVAAAYQTWRATPTFDKFVEYLQIGSSPHLAMVRARTRQIVPLTPDQPGVRALDALFARLAAAPWKTVVIVMPENPILALDVAHEYHREGYSDEATGVIATAARRHGLRVVDGRGWMPPEAFLDLDHMLPDLSGFQRPLAEEIVRALG